jgi:hypothetical protein
MPVVLRHGIEIHDPLGLVVRTLEAWRLDLAQSPEPNAFAEPDLRLANRDGARISSGEIAAILERRRAIERALRALPTGASLAGGNVPWAPLGQLFEAFADLRGVGFSKTTKALYRKRPALIPILDSQVQAYLADDDPGPAAAFAERALALVRGYKRDLDRNRAAVRAVWREIERRGYALTDVRILDLLILTGG